MQGSSVSELDRLFYPPGPLGGPAGHVQRLPALLDANGAMESHLLVHLREHAQVLRHTHLLAVRPRLSQFWQYEDVGTTIPGLGVILTGRRVHM